MKPLKRRNLSYQFDLLRKFASEQICILYGNYQTISLNMSIYTDRTHDKIINHVRLETRTFRVKCVVGPPSRIFSTFGGILVRIRRRGAQFGDPCVLCLGGTQSFLRKTTMSTFTDLPRLLHTLTQVDEIQL